MSLAKTSEVENEANCRRRRRMRRRISSGRVSSRTTGSGTVSKASERKDLSGVTGKTHTFAVGRDGDFLLVIIVFGCNADR